MNAKHAVSNITRIDPEIGSRDPEDAANSSLAAKSIQEISAPPPRHKLQWSYIEVDEEDDNICVAYNCRPDFDDVWPHGLYINVCYNNDVSLEKAVGGPCGKPSFGAEIIHLVQAPNCKQGDYGSLTVSFWHAHQCPNLASGAKDLWRGISLSHDQAASTTPRAGDYFRR